MKYIIRYRMNKFESDSRDAKKHARDLGENVNVYNKSGKLVSMAKLDECGKPYSCTIKEEY